MQETTPKRKTGKNHKKIMSEILPYQERHMVRSVRFSTQCLRVTSSVFPLCFPFVFFPCFFQDAPSAARFADNFGLGSNFDLCEGHYVRWIKLHWLPVLDARHAADLLNDQSCNLRQRNPNHVHFRLAGNV